MTTTTWGPTVWTFIHVLIEKLNNDALVKELFDILKSVVTNLPCPTCSLYAKNYLARISKDKINTKQDIKTIYFIFHNNVNLKLKKQRFDYENMKTYENMHLGVIWINFTKMYLSKGNMNMIGDSFHRSLIIKKISAWLKNNKNSFR